MLPSAASRARSGANHAAGEPWAPYNLTANANATYLDISHGRDDVYAIQSDST